MSYEAGSQSEAILFFGESGVAKGLVYTDFEAILDGVVGMQEFAGNSMRAAYATVDGRHRVTGLVLFMIGFDAAGLADRSWNIPLRHLVEKGDRGPDLGSGAIRLVCRSQCPVSWYHEQLWDPNMKAGENDFVFIRDFIREKAAYLGLPYAGEQETVPVLSPDPLPVLEPEVMEEEVPVLASPAFEMESRGPVQGRVASPRTARAHAHAEDLPVTDSSLDSTLGIIDQLREERARLALTIRDLRLQVTTMEAQQTEEIATLNYANQQKEEILNSQLEKVLAQLQSLKAQNAALREQTGAQRAQIDSLHDAIEQYSSDEEKSASQTESVRRQIEMEMNQRLEEESAKLREEIHVREMEIIGRDEKISYLQEQLSEAQSSQMASREAGADEFLEKLEKLGVNFIAFHPGAGHISIPFKNIEKYVDNPLGYAAEKCLVTEERYRAWLSHYQNPVCTRLKPDGTACGSRVIRIDVPSKFKPGDSDICTRCQGDRNIANVLAFR